MKIKPLFDRVVLRPIIETISKKGQIIMPVTVQKMPELATVVEVGPGGIVDGEEIKMVVKKGEKVIYCKYAGTEFNANGETLLIIKQTDIIAKVED